MDRSILDQAIQDAEQSRHYRAVSAILMQSAVQDTDKLGLTRREAAEFLGVTHQRISQILVQIEDKST